MAVPVITPDLTDISLCETTANWSAGALNSDFALQGTNCLAVQAKATTTALITYQPYATISSVSRSRSGGVATIVSGVHGMSVGQNFTMRLMGGVGYNGNWVVSEVVSTTSFRYVNAGTDEGVTSDIAGRSIRALDFTGKHLYTWMMITGVADTKTLGGYRLYAETDSTNYKLWHVGGKDTFPGGWGCFVVDPASTPTPGSSAGTLVATHITKVGVQFKTLSTITGTTPNCFWDAIRFGSGLTITSGVTDAISLEDIFDVDDNPTYKYGVITKGAGGTYLVQGKLTFGGTGSENIDFIDKNQIVIFPDNGFVSDSFYGIKAQCGSGVTNFALGEKSGDSGIKGCVFKSAGTKKFSADLSNAANTKVLVYGSIFINGGAFALPPNAANREGLNCVFDTCGILSPNSCILQSSNFISAADAAVSLPSGNTHNLTKCYFISCANAIRISVAGTDYEFDYLNFIGNTIDVDNTSGGTVVIANTNSINPPTTETGDTTINNLVFLTVYVKDEDNNIIQNARVAIYRDSDWFELVNELSDINGRVQTTYNYQAAEVPITIRIRMSSSGTTRYFPLNTSGTIKLTGFDLTAILIQDTIALP